MRVFFLSILMAAMASCMNGVRESAFNPSCLPQSPGVQAVLRAMEKPEASQSSLKLWEDGQWATLQDQHQIVVEASKDRLFFVEFFDPYTTASGVQEVPVDEWQIDPKLFGERQTIRNYQLNIGTDSCWITDNRTVEVAILGRMNLEMGGQTEELLRLATFEGAHHDHNGDQHKEDHDQPAMVIYWHPTFGKVLIEIPGEPLMFTFSGNPQRDKKLAAFRAYFLAEKAGDQ